MVDYIHDECAMVTTSECVMGLSVSTGENGHPCLCVCARAWMSKSRTTSVYESVRVCVWMSTTMSVCVCVWGGCNHKSTYG